MTIYRAWLWAHAAAAAAGFVLQLPLDVVTAGVTALPWMDMAQGVSLLLAVLISALAQVYVLKRYFQPVTAPGYVAAMVAPFGLLIALGTYVVVVDPAEPAAQPTSQAMFTPAEIAIAATLTAVLIAGYLGLLALQWLALRRAARGFGSWLLWGGLAAAFCIAVFFAYMAANGAPDATIPSSFAENLWQNIAATLATVAYGAISGLGVRRLTARDANAATPG